MESRVIISVIKRILLTSLIIFEQIQMIFYIRIISSEGNLCYQTFSEYFGKEN